MRWFFWALILIYVLLFVYALWLYKEDSWPLTAGLAFIAAGHWWWSSRKASSVEADTNMVPDVVEAKPVRWWQSPLPYMSLALLAAFLFIFLR